MKNILEKKCVLCNESFELETSFLTCPKCGEEGILDFVYDYDFIKDHYLKSVSESPRPDIWRYSALLPVTEAKFFTKTLIGPTPLIKSERLSSYTGIRNLYIKDDGRLPTASYKDRASALAIGSAKSLGINLICAASTGNAAASLAGLTAPEGIRSVIFVPASAPPAKLAQLATFGALVHAVDGTYDDAFALSLKASSKFGWYLRSTAVNPVLSEGKKTGAFEMAEQTGYGNLPETVFVSVGDGCIIGGIAKGFIDLYSAGIIKNMPRVIGVQAEGSCVIHDAFHLGTEKITVKEPTTRADSISVGFPRDYIKALRNVKTTGGTYVKVTDEEIFKSSYLLGSYEGVFAEPAGATAFAGVLKALETGIIDKNTSCGVFITGNGLKDVAGSSMAAPAAVKIPRGEAALDVIENLFKTK
ncbi:threonine synthase [Myxococcota bacterium]|nr:threonine synthase [Myxococcota bacterium]MBU1381121.1 threonine synthase [Myxococcota bacterium]MBU1497876.1 threonine synthase [Myxococcota bacterium]